MTDIAAVAKLTPAERALVGKLFAKIDLHSGTNKTKLDYYTGEHRVFNLGVAVPKKAAIAVKKALGWAGTAVDVPSERSKFTGWFEAGEGYGLRQVYKRNHLLVRSRELHTAARIYGQAYACIGSGNAALGEPDTLVTVHSPRNMTGIYDVRSNRLTSALSRIWDCDRKKFTAATLYLPEQTVELTLNDRDQWVVVSRDMHRLGRVPVVRFVNRPTGPACNGRSEITHALRSIVDQGMRCLLQQEMAREVYSVPHRYIVGASARLFDPATPEGERAQILSQIGELMNVPHDEDNPGADPTIGQFDAASPDPYVREIEMLTKLAAGEAGLPVSYYGETGAQASSAEAIVQQESRLVARTREHQDVYSMGWEQVAELVLLVRDRSVPESFYEDVSARWDEVRSISLGALTDAVGKQIQAGVLTPDSRVTYEALGYSEEQALQLDQDKRVSNAAALVAGLTERAQQANSNAEVAALAAAEKPAEIAA